MNAGSLPRWVDAPDDPPSAIREVKAALRARIAASGRSVADVRARLDSLIYERVEEIRSANDQRGTAWPVVEYESLAAGNGLDELTELVRRRGCLVVRHHFDREQALDWDRSLVDYLAVNRFDEVYRGPGDEFFSSVESTPEILPVYWSQAQMEARQSDRMAVVQQFLNSLWRSDSAGTRWFDPVVNTIYPDRVRRRPPGTTSGGLGAHIDAGTLDLWMQPDYQRAFRHVFDGSIESFDPWDAAHRTEGSQFQGTTMTSVFRTFQGWTALSDMRSVDGVLRAVPIPEAIAWLLLRPLADDVDEDDMCGVEVSRSFPVTERWHAPLLDAMSSIPDVEAGDSVRWHGDLIHGVAPVEGQSGWGNVMYIPAAPWCSRNSRYVETLRGAFESGGSPSDFPAEHYEREWSDRFMPSQLNAIGRRSLGM